MRIYEPREIIKEGKGTSLFHMTVSSDEEHWCHAVGPCANGCPGHPTKEEAERHWEQGRLDENLRLDGHSEEQQRKCLICGEWTQGCAFLTGELPKEWWLCDKHRTKEVVTKLHLNGD